MFGLQLSYIVIVEMTCAINTAANVIDIRGSTADCGGEFLLFGVIDLDDIAVNRHLAQICTPVASAKLRHLAFDKLVFVFRYAELNSYRAGAVCLLYTSDAADEL